MPQEGVRGNPTRDTKERVIVRDVSNMDVSNMDVQKLERRKAHIVTKGEKGEREESKKNLVGAANVGKNGDQSIVWKQMEM
jgi:hypothetical protein